MVKVIYRNGEVEIQPKPSLTSTFNQLKVELLFKTYIQLTRLLSTEYANFS